MKKKVLLIFLVIISGLVISATPFKFITFAYKDGVILSPLPDIKNTLGVADTVENIPPKLTGITNILLLGFDGRKGDKNPRCDALHLLNIDWDYRKMLIINIPRGTPVTLPKDDEPGMIISNSCSLKGLDFAKKEVEKITGEKIDYTVKIGFSQTQGLLRTLEFDAISTLQFLRIRKEYGVGDNQRTHNQGNFIRDLAITKLKTVNNMPKTVKYLLYKTIDTDMDFDLADSYLRTLSAFDFENNPDNIMTLTKSQVSGKLKDINLPEEEAPKDEEYAAYQANLLLYLDNLLSKTENYISAENFKAAQTAIKTPYSQKLWLQIDAEKDREDYHFKMLDVYSRSFKEDAGTSSMILDYLTEMENQGKSEYVSRGKALLEKVVN